MNSENTKLLDFLKTEYSDYKENILPLFASAEDMADVAKNDFLENLWDVISQHFDDAAAAAEDHCPKCGGSDLWYGDRTWHGDQFEQETTCNVCEFEFQQWYKIKFDGMTTGDHVDIE